MSFHISIVLMGIGFSAYADEPEGLLDCHHELGSVHNIVEPLSESSRTYGNGRIRILHLDTGGEPACCSSYLAILAPDPTNELGNRQCKLLTADSVGAGFMDLSVDEVKSSYDKSSGLLLKIPVERYESADGSGRESLVSIRINQSTGKIEIE